MSSQQVVCKSSDCRERGALEPGEEADVSRRTSEAMLGAIGGEISRIVGEGISIRSLNELARFAHTAQELLMIRSPLAEVRRKKNYGGGANITGAGATLMSTGSGAIGSYGGPGGFAMSPYQSQYGFEEGDCDVGALTTEAAQNETFGAKMTREIVSALGAMKRNSGASVQELISAIKDAKDAELGNIVSKLELALDEALGNESQADAGGGLQPSIEASQPQQAAQ